MTVSTLSPRCDVSDNFALTFVENDERTEPGQADVGIALPFHYFQGALARRTLERAEDGTWFAEIPNFEGLWAQGETQAEAIDELESALAGWLILKLEDHDNDIPVIDGINLNR